MYLLKLGGKQLWNHLIFRTGTQEMLLSTKVQCDFSECDFTPCGLWTLRAFGLWVHFLVYMITKAGEERYN